MTTPQQAQEPRPAKPEGRRSTGSVKAAAGLLVKEANRILKKYGGRIAPEPAQAIRASVDALARHREAKQWHQAEDEAERLDELLHQHASFARKSPLRETIENVGVAVLVALGLRSCLYEPFKIPSGSMMPTLVAGDHIFVNKFIYGIQVPFTTTVVGERWGHIARGDVVVFRYPIDESEDFIKRVIGLAGDTIRVDGNKVSIRRSDDAEFEELKRNKLPEKCRDDSGTQQVPHCELFEETLDGHTYVVRYKTNLDPRAGARRVGEWTVPEGHLLVMGDNRNESHDSLAWTRQVEAVAADGLLSVKDLRDLTDEKLFSLTRPDDVSARGDASFDHILYIADHASDAHGLELEIWRQPVLGSEAVYKALTAGEGRATTFAALIEGDERLGSKGNAKLRERLLRVGADIPAITLSAGEVAQDAVFRVDPDAVMRLRCGNAVCRTPGRVAEKVAEVVERWGRDRGQDARQILDGDNTARYSQHWTSRSATAETFLERRYSKTGAEPASPAGLVRLRAWRAPDESVDFVRDTALAAAGSSRSLARQVVNEAGDDGWLVEDEQKFTYVRADAKSLVAFSLECGRQRCASDRELLALVRSVEGHVPSVSKDRTRLPELLPPGDIPGYKEMPQLPVSERYEYDRIRLDATVRDVAYSLGVWVWLRPTEGLAEKLAALQADIPNAKVDDSVASGAITGDAVSGNGTQYAFAVPATEVVIRMQCSVGLCPTPEVARDLAKRAYQKAHDASNFVDPAAERPQPYVPRGNVKGRAERIWLPMSRFWLPIR
ncbi:signal peptidase I [Nannocystis bainbridge]|uniref:Signal peptidase I n=1 Tax=Nannocystis bainbridge TaxID=2995303 RepID=A0ABT5E228_9BACT|nr:signal peptidase I [Nannocystis bainbridge]MDC0719903.1 signal peptidase I [Nannocystis bainbridge]